MIPLPPSGLTVPRLITAALLNGFEETLGRNGMRTVLNQAGLSAWLQSEKLQIPSHGVDFSEISTLLRALEQTTGEKPARGLGRVAGTAAFPSLAAELGAAAQQGETADGAALQATLSALAGFLNAHSDQQCRLEIEGEELRFRITRCPFCWGTSFVEPNCYPMIGLLEGAGLWAVGHKPQISEIACQAAGDADCTFLISRSTPG